MKSFYIALCVLALLTAAIGLNYIYINKVSNQLSTVIDEIKGTDAKEASQKISDLKEIWSREKIKISMSVGYVALNKVDDSISSLEAALDEKSQYDFHNCLSILENAVKELTRLEKFSVFNIL